MTPNPPRNILFISYAHQDREICLRLAAHLSRRASLLGYEVWWDRAIQAGRTWRPQLAEKIELAGACILLASLEAMKSTFIWEKEIGPFIEADVPVSPLYVRAFDWRSFPRVAEFQFLNPPGGEKPLMSFSDEEGGEIFTEISRSLESWLPQLGQEPGAAARRIGVDGDQRRASDSIFEPGKLIGVPALPQDYQPRTDLLATFKKELLSEGPGAVAIMAAHTLGLHGSGGTGKSVMAAALADESDVRRAFPDGIYWVTVGEERRNIEVRQQQLAEWFGCDISHCRTNRDRREVLANALEGRRCLIIVDDVWSATGAVAFDLSGSLTRVLYTTRHENLLSHHELRARPLVVNKYDALESLEFLARATDQPLPLPSEAERVAFFTNGVVLSLSLAAGAYRHGSGWTDLARRFEESSRLYSDDLDGNLRAMRVGLSMLAPDEYKSYCDLVVFPQDTRVPERTIDRFWRYAGVDNSVELLTKFELSGLLNRDGDCIRFHDDQLFYLQLNAPSQVGRHAELLESFRVDIERWSDLDPEEPYMWDHLVDHLVEAMEIADAEALASDMAWISRRWWLSGGGAVERDLNRLCELLPERHRAQRLRRRLAQGAHLLTGLAEAAAIANTLAILTVDIVANTDQLRALVDRTWLEPSTPSVTGSDALVRVFNGHKGSVNAVVALTVAGRHRIASGGSDTTVRIWDQLAPDSEAVVLKGHRRAVRDLCLILLDGSEWLASAGDDRRILLWETADLQAEPLELYRHTSSVLALRAIESSNTFFLASGGEDRTVRLWYRADPQRAPLMLPRHTAPVVALGVAPEGDGFLLATASRDGKRILWRETSPGIVKPIADTSDHSSSKAGACLIPMTDRLIAASTDLNTVLLRDVWRSKKPIRSIGPFAAPVNTLNVHGSSTPGLLIGCADGVVHRWDWSMPPDSVQSFFGHTGPIADVCALETDRLRIASASEDGSARVWDPSLGESPSTKSDIRTSRLTAITFLPGSGPSRLATATADRRVAEWKFGTRSSVPLLDHHVSIRAMHGFEDRRGRWLAFGDDNGQVWITNTNLADGSIRKLPEDHVGPVRTMTAIADRGRWFVASAGHDRRVRVRTHDGERAYVLDGQHSGRILDMQHLEISGIAILVTAGADGTVRYWDPISSCCSTEVVELGGAQINAICSFEFNGVGWLAAASDEGDIDCWQVALPGDRVRLERLSLEGIVSLAWIPAVPEGLLGVLTAGGLLELWDVAEGSMRARARVGEHGLSIAPTGIDGGFVVAYDAAWTTLHIRQT